MRRVLIICLSPTAVIAELMSKVKADHPKAGITLLVGHRDNPPSGEIMDWRAFSAARLLREINAQKYELVIIACGREQYLCARYWKALLLAAFSGARRTRVCLDGKTPGQGLLHAFATGLGGALLLLAYHLLAGVFSAILLIMVLFSAILADMLAPFAGRSKSCASKR